MEKQIEGIGETYDRHAAARRVLRELQAGTDDLAVSDTAMTSSDSEDDAESDLAEFHSAEEDNVEGNNATSSYTGDQEQLMYEDLEHARRGEVTSPLELRLSLDNALFAYQCLERIILNERLARERLDTIAMDKRLARQQLEQTLEAVLLNLRRLRDGTGR